MTRAAERTDSVWVLISNNACMGVFLTRWAAEVYAEQILGSPQHRQYENWDGPWRLEDEDKDSGEMRYIRDTDADIPFVLERIKISD